MKTFVVAQSLLLALAGMAMARSSPVRREEGLCSVDTVEDAVFEADWIEDPNDIKSSKGSNNVWCTCRDDDCKKAACYANEWHSGRLTCTQIGGDSCGFFCDYTGSEKCQKIGDGCHGFVTLPPHKKEGDDRSEM